MKRFIVMLSALLSVSLLTPTAFAQKAHCDLTAIEASNDGKGIDSELKDIKELETPPLSATYTRFKFLGKAGSDLEVGVTTKLSPTTKQAAKLTFGGEEATSKKLQLKVELPD